MHPHSPSRVFLKSRMRELRVRTVKMPSKLPGCLPAGCLPEFAAEGDEVCSVVARRVADGDLAGALGAWFSRMEGEVIGIMGLGPEAAGRASGRAEGCRLVWRPAMG